jgi:hypothetical protein
VSLNAAYKCAHVQVTAIFESSLEVMISVFGETPSAAKVRACGVGVEC